MSKINFTKMHGCGNDYIYVEADAQKLGVSAGELARKISDRHTGIGADGLVLISRCAETDGFSSDADTLNSNGDVSSPVCDAVMRMFNSDGSEGSMCGNAIRCVARLLFDRAETAKGESGKSETVNPEIKIKTKSGIRTVVYNPENQTACADMGKPRILSKGFVNHIDVGNPHAVVFCEDLKSLSIVSLGHFFERSPYFVNGVNTEFVRVAERNKLEMRVWERGSGETLACGTGAVASAVAAVEHGFCDPDTDIAVKLRGGELTVRITGRRAFLTGNCEYICTGEYEYEN